MAQSEGNAVSTGTRVRIHRLLGVGHRNALLHIAPALSERLRKEHFPVPRVPPLRDRHHAEGDANISIVEVIA